MMLRCSDTGNNQEPTSGDTADHSNHDAPNNISRSQARREANLLSEAQRKEERERLINQAVSDGLSPSEARRLNDGERDLFGFEEESDDEIGDGIVNSLYKETESSEELRKLRKKQLEEKCAERGLLKSGNKETLIERLLNPQPSDFKRKPKAEQWKTSKAKALLIRLLMNKSSPIHNKTPEEVWESSDWFKLYPKERFVVNMKNLKVALEAREKIVENDNTTIALELAAITALGESDGNFDYPVWYSHEASKFIEADLKEGLDEGLKPSQFQQTRDEYLEFPPDVFRAKLYAEKRKQREMKLKVLKRNKLGSEKHKKEVEEEQARWHAEQEHDDTVDQMLEQLSIHDK